MGEGSNSEVALSGTWDERRTSPVELLWDLVFVFAVTQVTA
jgi:low temperature requirement protein LtrA